MDFEVTNVLSLSEHFTIVELKGLPTPLLLEDVCYEQKETPVAVFDFEKCLKSGKPSDFECMVKVMDSGIENLNIQVEACNALAHAQLKPTGIIFMCSKDKCQQTKRWMVW